MGEASTSSRMREREDGNDRSERGTVQTSRRRSRSPNHVDGAQSSTTRRNATLTRFGVSELTPDDYYAKSIEFKAWLSETKRKYLDEISGQEARRYFDKFARRWNEGRLSADFYTGQIRSSGSGGGGSGSGTQTTRHRWTFTKRAGYTTEEEQQLALVRDSVDTLTNSSTRGAIEARNAERKRPVRETADVDDTATTTGANTGARDTGWKQSARPVTDAALSVAAHNDQRARARQDHRDMDETWNGKATGRDRLLEKKRQRNSDNRDFANRRDADDGIEMDDRDLFDDDVIPPVGDLPPRALARNDTVRRNTEIRSSSSNSNSAFSRREQRAAERKAEMQEKVTVLKDKESKTMDMFKAMAQQRFGS